MKTNVVIEGQLHEVEGEISTLVEEDFNSKCEGDACGFGKVEWTGNGYNLSNTHPSQRVRISIRFYAFGCMSPTNVDLNPGESKSYGNGAFCSPYKANFI